MSYSCEDHGDGSKAEALAMVPPAARPVVQAFMATVDRLVDEGHELSTISEALLWMTANVVALVAADDEIPIAVAFRNLAAIFTKFAERREQ